MALHASEMNSGDRFAFGENWTQFLEKLDDERIVEAERSLKGMLGLETLAGLRFLDIGSGSGLFSLAARRLGATVHSLDFDPKSVACTAELRRRYFNDDPQWIVEEASALDADHLRGLDQFDIVYSWGVLHHTGAMWQALENATIPVALGGILFVSIYNDQGTPSRIWTRVKKIYNRSAKPVRAVMLAGGGAWLLGPAIVRDTLKGDPTRMWKKVKRTRGMDPWRDVVDWVGGYPFEVAKPEQILDFYVAKGYALVRMKTCGGRLGCNEFVFRRTANGGDPK